MSRNPIYSVHAWTGLDGLEEALRECQRLFEDVELDPLCNSADWLLAYARAFVSPDEIFGWMISADGAPIALFPFREEPPRGPLSLKRATLLTDGTFDSDYLGLWIHPGIEEEAVELCLDLLAERAQSQAIVLSGIPESSPILPALRSVLNRRGLPRRERPAECLSAELPADFTDYLGGLKRRMRSKVRRALRVAESSGAHYARCDDPHRLESRLSEMFDLHEQRWVDAGQDGAFADLRRRSFYRDVARLALSRGALRLSYLEWRGRRVAYQFGIVEGERYYQMQEGYAPELADMRVGVALRAMSIQRLIAEGVRHYDFMGGESRHKRDWGGKSRACTTIAFALPRWRAKLAYGLRALLDRRTREREEVRASA
jgi:CelD/BcsL family acetyltransferase involved in cellulose biosynthesis